MSVRGPFPILDIDDLLPMTTAAPATVEMAMMAPVDRLNDSVSDPEAPSALAAAAVSGSSAPPVAAFVGDEEAIAEKTLYVEEAVWVEPVADETVAVVVIVYGDESTSFANTVKRRRKQYEKR